MKIVCLGNKSNKADIEAIIAYLQELNIQVEPFYVGLLKINFTEIEDADVLIVLFRHDTHRDIYKECKRRREKGKITINVFTDNYRLTHVQRHSIGSNSTVYHAVSGENTVLDILQILEQKAGVKGERTAVEQPVESSDESSEYIEDDDFENSGNSGKTKIWLGIIAAILIIGGGIWGYSAYLDSAAKEQAVQASDREYDSWREYSDSDKGGAFIYLYGVLTNKSSDVVSSEFYEAYIKDKFLNESDFKDAVTRLLNGFSIEYDSSADIKNNLTGDLNDKMSYLKESDSSSSELWNPVEDIKRSGYFRFLTIEPINPNSLVKIHYTLNQDSGNGSKDEGSINLKWENGGWKIDDFFKDDKSYKEYLASLKEKSSALLTEGSNLFEGSYNDGGRNVPVSLIIKMANGYVDSAHFISDETGINVTMRPYRAPEYAIGFTSPDDDIVILLNLPSDNSLSGRLEFPMEVPSPYYDIVLRKK